MNDALDKLMAHAIPAQENRITLEPGVEYWHAHGRTPDSGLSYAGELPAGIHIGAGNGELTTTVSATSFNFSGPSHTCFRLAEPLAFETRLSPASVWTSLGLLILPGSAMADAFATNWPSAPQPSRASPVVTALLSGAGVSRYRGLARTFALRAEAYALLATSTGAPWTAARNRQQQRRSAVDAATAILDRDYANPPLLAELARQVGVNRRYLTGDFRTVHGVSIAAYVARLRLAHADTMLAAGLTVADVALRVGLSPSHFALAYRRRFGQPPSLRRR